MGFDVIPTEVFKKEAKRLIKKFPSLKVELSEIENLLTENPKSGDDLGHNTFKIRIGIKSKGKGKKGRKSDYLCHHQRKSSLPTYYF